MAPGRADLRAIYASSTYSPSGLFGERPDRRVTQVCGRNNSAVGNRSVKVRRLVELREGRGSEMVVSFGEPHCRYPSRRQRTYHMAKEKDIPVGFAETVVAGLVVLFVAWGARSLWKKFGEQQSRRLPDGFELVGESPEQKLIAPDGVRLAIFGRTSSGYFVIPLTVGDGVSTVQGGDFDEGMRELVRIARDYRA